MSDPRQERLAEIAEVARAVVGRDFGFVATSDGAVHLAVAPPGEDATPVVDLLRVRQLLTALGAAGEAAGELVVVDEASRDARWGDVAAEGPGPPIHCFAAARLYSHSGRSLGVVGGGGAAGGPFVAGVAGALEALTAVASAVLASSVDVSEVHVDALLEHASDLIIVLDMEGRISYASPSIEAICGFRPDEVVGRFGVEVVHPDERAAIVAEFERVHRSPQGPLRMRFRLARADGTYLRVESVNTSVVDGGRVHGVVVNIRPSGEDRPAATVDEVRERNAQAVLDSLRDAVIVCASDGTVLSCNAAALTVLGRAAGQIVGRPYQDIAVALAGPGGAVVDETGRPLSAAELPIAVSLRDSQGLAGVVHGFVEAGGRTRWLRFSTELLDVGAGDEHQAVVVGVEEVTDERAAADAERQQGERDRTILDSLRDGVLMFDAAARIVTSNSAVERLFEVSTDWLKGRAHEEMIAVLEQAGGGLCDEDGAPFPIERHPVVVSRDTGDTVSNVMMGIRRSRGLPPNWFQVSARALVRPHRGPPYPVVVSFNDVTDIRTAELERDELVAVLARERMFLSAVLGRVGEGIEACDAAGRVTLFNEAMGLFLQPAPSEETVGAPPSVLGLARPDGRALTPGEHPLLVALSGARVSNVELVVTTPNGSERCMLVNGQQLRAPSGEKLGAVVAFHDVTEQKRIESELTVLALHDPLTGLANRILLTDRLEVAFERGVREDTGVGLLMLDLDDFKRVNDTHGHGTGDGVLVAVANRLRGAVRPGDTVARLGGDEFVVVCPLSGPESELERVRERLAEVLTAPVVVDDLEIEVAASIGLAVSGPGKSEPESLLRSADESMYRVKESRRRTADGTS